jgi:hypothetical protein
MKYIYAFILIVIIFILALPVMVIKWDMKNNWLDDVVSGVQELCGID